MYHNLNAEMLRRGYTRKALAASIGMPYSIFLDKLCGRSQFTLNEAHAIKLCLASSLSIEELFFIEY